MAPVSKQSQQQQKSSHKKKKHKSNKLKAIQNGPDNNSKQIKLVKNKLKPKLLNSAHKEKSTVKDIAQNKALKSSQEQNHSLKALRSSDVLQAEVTEKRISAQANEDHRAFLLWNQTNEDASNTSLPEATSSTISSLFVNSTNIVLVLLKEPIYLYGQLQCTLLAGSVDIYGYNPRINEKVQIYSPRGLCTVAIKPQPTSTACQLNEKFWEYVSELYLAKEVHEIYENFNPHEDALLLLESNFQAKSILRTFQICFNENVFPNFNYTPRDRLFPNTEAIIRCRIDFECDKDLKVPKYWKSLNLLPSTRMLIAGGMSVGKSTLLRHLVNRHLVRYEEILVIDLDIGQPELFVPQTISCTRIRKPILGPGYFFNIQPEQAYYIGECSITICAGTYLRAVRKLLKYCHGNEQLVKLPWLVNTMGYNKGFGIELIAAICAYLQPTDVVQIQSNKAINNFDQQLTPQVVANLERSGFCKSLLEDNTTEESLYVPKYHYHELLSAVQQESRFQKEWTMTRKDMRYAIMMCWLSLALPKELDYFNDAKAVVLNAQDIQIYMREQNEWQLSQDALLDILKCSIVHICHKNGNENEDNPLTCKGLGLTRAVNVDEKKIYLLPALRDSSLLSKVNCLAVGSMPIPSAFHLNQSARVKGNIPFVYSTISSNATRPIKQIYHRPDEFLSGMRKKEKL